MLLAIDVPQTTPIPVIFAVFNAKEETPYYTLLTTVTGVVLKVGRHRELHVQREAQ